MYSQQGLCFMGLFIYLLQNMWMLQCTSPLLLKLRFDELLTSYPEL